MDNIIYLGDKTNNHICKSIEQFLGMVKGIADAEQSDFSDVKTSKAYM